MEGYNGDENEDDEFNVGSFANASGYGDGSETRDFLSQAPPRSLVMFQCSGDVCGNQPCSFLL
jgi:hypothetical protein